jgi:preprotein translocase subunit SecD
VDANILIFERVKEELRLGRTISDSVATGFSRAWFSIRDSNSSSIISAAILFWFGTSLIKGFALTLGIGVLVSMLSAISISRVFLYTIEFVGEGKVARFLFSSGLGK